MSREDRKHVVRPDALGVLGWNGEAQDPSASAQPRRAVEPARHNGVAHRQQGARGLGLLTEKEFKRLVTAQFEYPALSSVAGVYSTELVAAFKPFSVKGRALRYLAARILLEAYTEEGLCFSVAAAHRGGGATYIAANLAVVFSELGLRTLIVDANLRRPRLQRMFNSRTNSGWGSMVPADGPSIPAIEELDGFRGLALLPAGNLGARMRSYGDSGELARVLPGLRQHYDVVICDSPSWAAGDGDGCEVVAGICGNAVLVLRQDETGVSEARSALATLDAVGANVIGTVLCKP